MAIKQFIKRSDEAKRCIYPVIHQLDALGENEYGGRYYDGDMNVLHVNITKDIRPQLRTSFLDAQGLTNFDAHIKFHTVRYTNEQLMNFQNIVDRELMGKLGIHGTSQNVKTNKLLLEVDDDSAEARAEIANVLAKLGYTDTDMFEIARAERQRLTGSVSFAGNPVDMSNGVPDRALDAIAAAGILAAPGSWLGHGTSSNSIYGVTSLCTGFYYNGQPGFLTCGHGGISGEKIFYQPVPSSGRYPTDLFDYGSVVEIGQMVGVYYQSGDAYDCGSIIRTNSNVTMNSRNFCGATVDGDSGVPEVGEMMAVCGCADGAVFGECLSKNYTVDVYDHYGNATTKINMLHMDSPVTSGTSGGCVAYQDDATNKVNLTGIVTGSNDVTSVHSKYSLVKSRFNLTTVF